MRDIAVYTFCLIWNIFVLGGSVYLVGWQGWNPWWLLATIVLLVFPKGVRDEKDNE